MCSASIVQLICPTYIVRGREAVFGGIFHWTMRTSTTHNMGKEALQDMCRRFELAAIYIVPASMAECPMLDATDSKQGYNRIITNPVPGLWYISLENC